MRLGCYRLGVGSGTLDVTVGKFKKIKKKKGGGKTRKRNKRKGSRFWERKTRNETSLQADLIQMKEERDKKSYGKLDLLS